MIKKKKVQNLGAGLAFVATSVIVAIGIEQYDNYPISMILLVFGAIGLFISVETLAVIIFYNKVFSEKEEEDESEED